MTTKLELFIENGALTKQQLDAAGRMRMLLIIAPAIIAMSLFSMYATQSYLMLSLCVILLVVFTAIFRKKHTLTLSDNCYKLNGQTMTIRGMRTIDDALVASLKKNTTNPVVRTYLTNVVDQGRKLTLNEFKCLMSLPFEIKSK